MNGSKKNKGKFIISYGRFGKNNFLLNAAQKYFISNKFELVGNKLILYEY